MGGKCYFRSGAPVDSHAEAMAYEGCSCRDQPMLVVFTMTMELEQAILVMLVILVFVTVFMAVAVAANELKNCCCALVRCCRRRCKDCSCSLPFVNVREPKPATITAL